MEKERNLKRKGEGEEEKERATKSDRQIPTFEYKDRGNRERDAVRRKKTEPKGQT